jgi:membrane protease YdiL (CAAX protease family)
MVANLIFAIGAGLYEELVFRLMAIALLHLVLVDLFGLPWRWGAVIAVAGSAALFAGYHFTGDNAFTWSRFLYFFAAGLYFAAIYVLRGFGIVAAVHAFYDVVYVVIKFRFPESGGA